MIRKFLAILIAAAALALTPLPTSAQSTSPTYYTGGVNVGVLTNTTLLLEPFSIYLFGINQIVDIPPTVCADGMNHGLCVDLTTIGLNGMDVNPNGAGHMPPDWAYNIFMLYNATDGACGMTPCLGTIITVQTAIGNVTLPAGWHLANTSYRKIMTSAVVVGGALAPNHLSNWPMPTFNYSARPFLTFFTTTQSMTPVDMARFVPDGGRFVCLRAVLTGTGNNLWLSPGGDASFNTLFAYNDSGVKSRLCTRMQYTYGSNGSPSTAKVFVTFSPGTNGRVDLYLESFDWTEVD